MLQQEFNKAEELAGQLKTYIHTEIELAKLTIAEKLSKVLSNFMAVLIVSMAVLFFTLFASIALAWLVGVWMGKIWTGFLIVSLLYLLVGVIAWYAKERLLRAPIMNAIIRQLFNNGRRDKNKK